MSKFKQNLANIITCSRIVGTLIMAFLPARSLGFFIVYSYAGLSDVADGYVARKLGTVSAFGSKLDSISDLLFYIVMMVKILPLLIYFLPHYVMLTIYSIFAVRILIYIYTGLSKHIFLSSHSYLNKATGLLLFFVPFLVTAKFFVYYAITICVIAIVSALNEIRFLSRYDRNTPQTPGE